MSKAPVCPISRSQAVSGMPARNMPAIPRALDLQSAIIALNQMALLLNPGVNSGQSTGFSQGESLSGPDNNNNPKQDDGGGAKRRQRWDETDRGVEQVRYNNPDVKTIYVLIPRIYRLDYEEIKTQTEWEWRL